MVHGHGPNNTLQSDKATGKAEGPIGLVAKLLTNLTKQEISLLTWGPNETNKTSKINSSLSRVKNFTPNSFKLVMWVQIQQRNNGRLPRVEVGTKNVLEKFNSLIGMLKFRLIILQTNPNIICRWLV